MRRHSFLAAALAALAALAGDPGAGAAEKPIRLGQIVPVTGEAAESGLYQRRGAELAAEQVNNTGGINGRPLQLVLEDDKTTNPGAVAALQRLLEDGEIPAIIGSIRSTQVQAMLPTINEAGLPVMIGGTNYGLTHGGSKWVFRCRPNDGISAKVIARFVVDELGHRKVALIYASDAFGQGARDLVVPALRALKAEPVLVQGYNNFEKDFTAVLSALQQSGADALISYQTFTPDLGIMARQMKQLGIKVTWVGSPSIVAIDARRLAGDALYGTYGVADFNPDGSPKSKAFATAYRAKYGVDPDNYSSWTYDAVLVLADAMRRAPDLKPETIRKAILAIRGLEGAEGEYNFDENGDGLDHYHVVKNDGGTIRLFRTIRVAR